MTTWDDAKEYYRTVPVPQKNPYALNIDTLAWRLRTSEEQSLTQRIKEAQSTIPHGEKVEDPIKKIIQAAIAASCTIFIHSPDGEWTGSGFHIGQGVIATAAHVAPPELGKQPAKIQVSFDGQTLYPAQLAASQPVFDAALLMCPHIIRTIPPVILGDSDTAEVGDIVAAIGSPEGWHDTATVGRITNVHQELGQNAPSPAWNDIIFVDCDILQGSSGGMIINTAGEVMGLVLGVTGTHADIGIGERSVCPSNKIRTLLQSTER